MQVFLDHFAATIGEDEHAVMVLEQAGWYDARALNWACQRHARGAAFLFA
jgi:hypothetical protein